MNDLSSLLPEFPRTPHLPIEANAASDDKVCSIDDLRWLLSQTRVVVEEKLDGANSGITIHNDQPVIRNRSKILSKNYNAKGKAKVQFVAIWTWFYDNKNKIQKLADILGFMPSIYGEWLYAKHTTHYDSLPDLFVAYDIYNPSTKEFLDPLVSRALLTDVGFSVPPLRFKGQVDIDTLLALRNMKSEFSTSQACEGVYIKVGDANKMTARFKMVAQTFSPSETWVKEELAKNTVKKTRL